MNKIYVRRLALLMAVSSFGIQVFSPARAQDANEVNLGVSEIVVTATRRAESIQDVPLTITALDDQRLEMSNATTLQDVSALAPGFQALPAFVPGNAVFQLRGQVQTDTNPAIEPSVGIYFDDVYIARAQGSLTNFLDLERVEVVKGPQGTLFGRNTTGGALRLISKKPIDDFEGHLKAGYQSFDQVNMAGVINVPIAEGVAFRAAGQYQDKNGGYATNLASGNKIDKFRTVFGRASLLLEPTDRLSFLVQGDYTNTKSGGVPNRLKAFVPGNSVGSAAALAAAAQTGVFDPANLPASITAGTAVLQEIAANPNIYDVAQDVRNSTGNSAIVGATGITFPGGRIDPFNNFEVWGGALTANLEGENVSIKSITSYRDVKYDSSYDLSGTALYLLESRGKFQQHQFSQEVIFSGDTGFGLHWTAGGIYFDEVADQSDLSVAFAYLTVPRGGYAVNPIGNLKAKSWGVFAQGTYDVTDQFSFTGGIRYSEDKRVFTATTQNVSATGDITPALTTLPGYDPTIGGLKQKAKFGEISYTVSAQYRFELNKQLYLRTSRGYKSGGFNARISAPETIGFFRPEIVTDYELGLKADWLDRTLRTNLAFFYSKTKDTQQSSNAIGSTGTAITLIRNQGKREVYGVEADVTIRPVDWFQVDSTFAYMDGALKNPSALDSDYLPNVPKYTWTLGTTIETPLGKNLNGMLRIDGTFRDKMLDTNSLRAVQTINGAQTSNGAILLTPEIEERFLLSARLTIRHESSGIEASLFGTNLLNDEYDARVVGINGTGLVNAVAGEPRVIGVEMKIPFGRR